MNPKERADEKPAADLPMLTIRGDGTPGGTSISFNGVQLYCVTHLTLDVGVDQSAMVQMTFYAATDIDLPVIAESPDGAS